MNAETPIVPRLNRDLNRIRVRLSGTVQGVGMRPFVHTLAMRFGLSGFVRNGADGVTIEVEGRELAAFLVALKGEAPPLAQIERVEIEPLAATGEPGFMILASTGGPVSTRIGTDAATCPACLGDIFNQKSRFFAYPFTNCTHCGPRYTIARGLPYDRAATAMAGFTFCDACADDYADPANRRFHAEALACPSCGPRLSHLLPEIADALRAGRIVALKGIGGFHLMCDAGNEGAVAELRRRKGREAKPFAVMVANAASVGRIAAPTEEELALMLCTARPIVLMAGRPGVLAPSVSPRLRRIGVVAAYAPVHHLLFAALKGDDFARHDPTEANGFALVATSANPGGEPLVIDNAVAADRLAGIADLIVTHDRPIVIRADDSVAEVIAGRPVLIRRARGFVPEPIELLNDGPPTLALGAHLKAAVCVTRGNEAFLSQHVGDLDRPETIRFYRETIGHLLKLLDVAPEIVASDLHPDYASTRIAADYSARHCPVQHHVAHVAAVAAEHKLTGPVYGLALDGHGLGPNGENWGGELLEVGDGGFRRLGGLAPLPLPGGERAAREPVRMAAGALAVLGRAGEIATRFAGHAFAAPYAAHCDRPGLFGETSSLGRLFDAASGLLGLSTRQAYEGQAAMELEALVRAPRVLDDGFTLSDGRLDFRPLLGHLADLGDPVAGAELFHGTVVAGLAALARESGARHIVLSGGCVANRILSAGLIEALTADGIEVLLPQRVPPGDGGLALGQAVMARAIFNRHSGD